MLHYEKSRAGWTVLDAVNSKLDVHKGTYGNVLDKLERYLETGQG